MNRSILNPGRFSRHAVRPAVFVLAFSILVTRLEAAPNSLKATPDEVGKAAQNGTLSFRLTTPEEWKALFGPADHERKGKDGDMDKLILEYPQHGQLLISLVAEVEGEVVGNAALTQVMLMPTVPGLRMFGLGPLAVLPEFQRQGIGSQLVREAVAQTAADGWQALVALGAPEYYARFGFVPARQVGLATEFRLLDNTFTVLELQPGILQGLQGVVRFQPEFSGF